MKQYPIDRETAEERLNSEYPLRASDGICRGTLIACFALFAGLTYQAIQPSDTVNTRTPTFKIPHEAYIPSTYRR